MTFSPDEIERYQRHLVLSEMGGPGQQKLKAARLLVIGAGGLGAPVIQYCAAAGVGTLGIADPDVVSLSNLQRQVVHATSDVGRPKVDSAGDEAERLNPHITVRRHRVRVDAENAVALIGDYTIVADCTDQSAARYVISDACFHARVPLVTAAVNQWDGSLTLLKPYLNGPDGTPYPTYRCLFPEPVPDGVLPTCAEAGVLNALAGAVGTLQALAVIREIVGIDEGPIGQLLLIDGRNFRFETIRYRWDPANPLNGTGRR
jgi:molybdopterin/thiamine biosynthesis adenylyltransferase